MMKCTTLDCPEPVWNDVMFKSKPQTKMRAPDQSVTLDFPFYLASQVRLTRYMYDSLTKGGRSRFEGIWKDRRDSIASHVHLWEYLRNACGESKFVKVEANSKTSNERPWRAYSSPLILYPRFHTRKQSQLNRPRSELCTEFLLFFWKHFLSDTVWE